MMGWSTHLLIHIDIVSKRLPSSHIMVTIISCLCNSLKWCQGIPLAWETHHITEIKNPIISTMQASIDCGVKLNLQAQNQKSKSIIYIYYPRAPLFVLLHLMAEQVLQGGDHLSIYSTGGY